MAHRTTYSAPTGRLMKVAPPPRAMMIAEKAIIENNQTSNFRTTVFKFLSPTARHHLFLIGLTGIRLILTSSETQKWR